MPKILFDNTAFGFPIFNMNIPDQYRAHWFMKDVEERFLSGRMKFPSFVNIAICNDHGSSSRAEGYPYLASYMADNDLALGRIVEFLSHTPYWKNMAIFVTEDDMLTASPIPSMRSAAFFEVISPWAKKGYVSHRHTTILSMHRTLYQILGLAPLNMFDALASDLSDSFTRCARFPSLSEPERRSANFRSREGEGSERPGLWTGAAEALGPDG